MDIAKLCTRPLVTIEAGASLHAAAMLMREQHVGALVVVQHAEPPRVLGVVTDRDMALETLGREVPSVPLTIGQLVKAPPIAVRGTAGVREAVAAMEQGGVRRLLVLDEHGGVLGLVSSDDLVDAIAEDLEGLARALRAGIAREARPPQPPAAPPAAPRRPVFPAFGSAAMR